MKPNAIYVQLTEQGVITYQNYVLRKCKSFEKTSYYQSMCLYYYQFLDRINHTFLGTLEEIYNIFGNDLLGNIVGCCDNTEEIGYAR